MIQFTGRLNRIIKNAEREAGKTNAKVLQPVHLLIACLEEKTGALGEVFLKCSIDKSVLKTNIKSDKSLRPERSDYFHMEITMEVRKVLETAVLYMKRYNQIFVNEGHLLKAMIATKVMDDFLSEEDRKILLTLGTTSRDMITHLGHYTFPNLDSPFIRRVNKDDEQLLVSFIEQHFSTEWAMTIKEAFLYEDPTIYIAFDSKESIIGFAAFDVYKQKKGYFGPMGVMTNNRKQGIGYALLHYCLKEMKEIGYEYAIIGDAGPLEFYEKACQAVVIPMAAFRSD